VHQCERRAPTVAASRGGTPWVAHLGLRGEPQRRKAYRPGPRAHASDDSEDVVGLRGHACRGVILQSLAANVGRIFLELDAERTRCAPTPQTQKLRVAVVDSPAIPGSEMARLMQLHKRA